jgi:hypothetical protein
MIHHLMLWSRYFAALIPEFQKNAQKYINLYKVYTGDDSQDPSDIIDSYKCRRFIQICSEISSICTQIRVQNEVKV